MPMLGRKRRRGGARKSQAPTRSPDSSEGEGQMETPDVARGEIKEGEKKQPNQPQEPMENGDADDLGPGPSSAAAAN